MFSVINTTEYHHNCRSSIRGSLKISRGVPFKDEELVKYLLAAVFTTAVFLTIDFHGWSLVPLSPLSLSLFKFTSGPPSIFPRLPPNDLLPPKLVDPVAKLFPLPPKSGVVMLAKLLSLTGIVMLVSEALDFALVRLRAFIFWPQLVKF